VVAGLHGSKVYQGFKKKDEEQQLHVQRRRVKEEKYKHKIISPSNDSKLDCEDPFSLSPDRQAVLLSFREMQSRWPDRNWRRFIAANVDYSKVLKKE
jgi:hypothetical protein